MKNFSGVGYKKLLEVAINATPAIVRNYITHLRARVGLLERGNDSLKEDWERAVSEARFWKKQALESEAKLKASERKRKILEADLISANRSILEIENKVKDLKANYELNKIRLRVKAGNKKIIGGTIEITPSTDDSVEIIDKKEIPKAIRLSPLQEVRKGLNTLA